MAFLSRSLANLIGNRAESGSKPALVITAAFLKVRSSWRVGLLWFSVRSIPQTVLIDAEGKIIARNLKGAALEAKLKEILGTP